ncbi:MAG: hypothetical protein PHX14_12365 [Syntrophomonadaceae bacterium]|nr:hypothetical protein [Syntrophomonadaceae bacterium]
MAKGFIKATSTIVIVCFMMYMLVLQLALPYWANLNFAYQYRIKYDFIVNETVNLDVILEQIAAQIKREKLQDYLIVLGDSVAYSGPGPSSQSLAYYMEDIARQRGWPDLRVYNLAMPAMQTGDIYTMLLKLERHGISSDHLIFNLIYAGFAERNPDPSIVFWLQNDLKELDPDTYQAVLPQLESNNYKKSERLQLKVHNYIVSHLNIYRYRYLLRKDLEKRYYQACNIPLPDDSLGDAGIWTEKPGLNKMLQQQEYAKGFSAKSFDMSEKNPQILFLNKIIARQKNKQTIIFLAGINDVLLREKVRQPGYMQNLKLIDHYLAGKNVSYVNLQGRIDDSRFSDHVHLTAKGYQELSKILLDRYVNSRGLDYMDNRNNGLAENI